MTESKTAVSLFASGGIGDLALHAAGVRTLVANELLEDRARLYERNNPETDMVCGDINEVKDEVIQRAQRALDGRTLDFLFATPPCQGMSKNGRGKLLQGIRSGSKPELDVRNQLMLAVLEVASVLRPLVIVTENVPEMERTIIRAKNGEYLPILEVMRNELEPLGYLGSAQVVEFADYGVPQRRQRLITVFSRAPALNSAVSNGSWLPRKTHARTPSLLEQPWVTVQDVISHLPTLDASSKALASSSIPMHSVPTLDAAKYFWVSNTPPGQGAFDNQCVNPACLFDGNPAHSNVRGEEGINRSSKQTPLHCQSCGELLPRPWVLKDGVHRIMSGFTSAYKRMRGDLPASALTRNLSYACSDQKLHPTQHRVLSLAEACILHTISQYDYVWERSDGRKVPDKLIRDVIGESIPPAGLQVIFQELINRLTRKNLEEAA
jgi:DNA (cytosine-5)-methyltransferase 1